MIIDRFYRQIIVHESEGISIRFDEDPLRPLFVRYPDLSQHPFHCNRIASHRIVSRIDKTRNLFPMSSEFPHSNRPLILLERKTLFPSLSSSSSLSSRLRSDSKYFVFFTHP